MPFTTISARGGQAVDGKKINLWRINKMKLFFSELKADYDKYHFPYQVWLLKEDNDMEEKIYDNGFLPIRNMRNIFYLSRSLRVNLDKFEISSENRRILKKTEDISSELISLTDFNYTPEIQKFCKDYADQKLGTGLFSVESIKGIFNNGIFNTVIVFKEKGQKEVGYAVCLLSENFLQYAYAFYDLKYLKENLGARMMLEAVSWSKSENKKFAYLGTCYENSALYKTEFSGFEFFNGFKWSSDKNELKKLIDFGLSTVGSDETYLLKNKEYLELFYNGDLNFVLNNFGLRVNF